MAMLDRPSSDLPGPCDQFPKPLQPDNFRANAWKLSTATRRALATGSVDRSPRPLSKVTESRFLNQVLPHADSHKEASEKRAVKTNTIKILDEGNQEDWGVRQEVEGGQRAGAEELS